MGNTIELRTPNRNLPHPSTCKFNFDSEKLKENNWMLLKCMMSLDGHRFAYLAEKQELDGIHTRIQIVSGYLDRDGKLNNKRVVFSSQTLINDTTQLHFLSVENYASYGRLVFFDPQSLQMDNHSHAIAMNICSVTISQEDYFPDPSAPYLDIAAGARFMDSIQNHYTFSLGFTVLFPPRVLSADMSPRRYILPFASLNLRELEQLSCYVEIFDDSGLLNSSGFENLFSKSQQQRKP